MVLSLPPSQKKHLENKKKKHNISKRGDSGTRGLLASLSRIPVPPPLNPNDPRPRIRPPEEGGGASPPPNPVSHLRGEGGGMPPFAPDKPEKRPPPPDARPTANRLVMPGSERKAR